MTAGAGPAHCDIVYTCSPLQPSDSRPIQPGPTALKQLLGRRCLQCSQLKDSDQRPRKQAPRLACAPPQPSRAVSSPRIYPVPSVRHNLLPTKLQPELILDGLSLSMFTLLLPVPSQAKALPSLNRAHRGAYCLQSAGDAAAAFFQDMASASTACTCLAAKSACKARASAAYCCIAPACAKALASSQRVSQAHRPTPCWCGHILPSLQIQRSAL